MNNISRLQGVQLCAVQRQCKEENGVALWILEHDFTKRKLWKGRRF